MDLKATVKAKMKATMKVDVKVNVNVAVSSHRPPIKASTQHLSAAIVVHACAC